MDIDAKIKFKRARKGYDPKEVDDLLDELFGEIRTLKRKNRSLSDTVAEYNEKIKQFEEITRRMEEERDKEKQWAAGVTGQSGAYERLKGQLAELAALVSRILSGFPPPPPSP